MSDGKLNDYTLQRRKDGKAEIAKMLLNPVSYEEALAQTNRLQDQEQANSEFNENGLTQGHGIHE